ncbi:hypothetical protein D3C75_1302500 [compost metagenome]
MHQAKKVGALFRQAVNAIGDQFGADDGDSQTVAERNEGVFHGWSSVYFIGATPVCRQAEMGGELHRIGGPG